MRDLFGNKINNDTPVRINVFADEIQEKTCPITRDRWFYIGIIITRDDDRLLNDVVNARYCNNVDTSSSYYFHNDRIVHWVDVNDADSKNICKRWLEYIMSPAMSEKVLCLYVLGINDSKLNKGEFAEKSVFNSKYNRFFRSTILYALKSRFPNQNIIVGNIYHEEGQQQEHEYFPWHCIAKIQEREERVSIECNSVTFLPKSHRENPLSNIVQMCDLFLGLCTSALHGIQESRRSKYRTELMDMFLPLFQRMINEPHNKNSRYAHANRLMVRFFPQEQTSLGDIRRLRNQFYTKRKLYYIEQRSGQLSLHL